MATFSPRLEAIQVIFGSRMVVISRYTVPLPSRPSLYSITRTRAGFARRFLSLAATISER